VVLLGAYQDLELEFYYPKVFAYSLQGDALERGHGDWRYDEFRLLETGILFMRSSGVVPTIGQRG
jgi:hypothetical protein